MYLNEYKAQEKISVSEQLYLRDKLGGIVDILLILVLSLLQQESEAAAAGHGRHAGRGQATLRLHAKLEDLFSVLNGIFVY